MQQGIAHELVEGDHYGHRIAGHAEEHGVAHAAKGHRPSRAHGDLPEEHLAELRHQLLHEVGLADRYATGGDDGVGVGRGLAESGFQLRRIVAHHAEIVDLDAEALEHAVQGVAIGVVYLAVLQRVADRGELVAGGEHRHAQLATYVHLADAERGDEAELRRAQHLSGRQHRHADLQVFARIAHVLRALLPRRHADAIAFAFHHFLYDHGIG